VEMTYDPPVTELATARSRALIAGVIGLVLCALGFFLNPGQFFRAWLIAYWFWLGISLGSMALMMVQHLSGGQWGVFRRIFEAASRTFPLMLVLFIPIALGMRSLYPWARPELVQADEILRHRAFYMAPTFVLVRAAIYLIGWWVISSILSAWSLRQDRGDMSVNLRMQRLSGGGLVFYGLTTTLAAIDWLMSLNPHWFSTIFGFLTMGGQGLSGLAFTIVIATMLVPRPPMASLLKPSHFHDLGKLMLAFVMLWAYFNYSQYLLTYAANLTEEIPYMIVRISHGWQALALFLVIFHFGAPFIVLLWRDLKRRPRQLVLVAGWILFARYADVYMLVSPEFSAAGQNLHTLGEEAVSHFFLNWVDLAAPLAIGGVWLWMFFTELAKRPLFALGDPYLRESLQSSGGH
jgi:hypothetical protein